eukprot:g434.t1
MRRTDRLFDLIQRLRAAREPVTAARLAEELEVSPRTVYRDVVTLQSMRVPIDGEAGVGYVMRAGYDLPPLNFSREEIEAIMVGLSLLPRTGDRGLQDAARRVLSKIDTARVADGSLNASGWGVRAPADDLPARLRDAIHREQALFIRYTRLDGRESARKILPLSMTYYIEVAVLGAWCALREDFRHFRIDRIQACASLPESFAGEGARLRRALEAARD